MGFFSEFFSSDDDETEESEGTEGSEQPDGSAEQRPSVRPPAEREFDGAAVLEAAGVEEAKRSVVEKAQSLLASLPDSTPPAVERQIVEAAFRAFEIPLGEIIAGAVAEVRAFEAFITEGEAHNAELQRKGEARVAELEAEIEQVKGTLERAGAHQAKLAKSAGEQIETIRPVLSFFAFGGDEEDEYEDEDEGEGEGEGEGEDGHEEVPPNPPPPPAQDPKGKPNKGKGKK